MDSLQLAPRRSHVAVGVTVLLMSLGVTEAGQRPADEPRQPIQELIRTEVVYPQEKGEFQLTLGFAADEGRSSRALAFPLQAEFGLTDAWQVELEWQSYSRVRTGDLVSSGRGGISVATKYSFMHIAGSPVHAAVGLEVEFPGGLGRDGFREDEHEVEPFIALAADLRAGAQAFLHVGKSFIATASDDDNGDLPAESSASVQWNAGALVALRRTTVALEFNARTSGSPWRPDKELYAIPSITFLLPRPWEVGVGLPIGLGGRADKFGVAVLVIYER